MNKKLKTILIVTAIFLTGVFVGFSLTKLFFHLRHKKMKKEFIYEIFKDEKKDNENIKHDGHKGHKIHKGRWTESPIEHIKMELIEDGVNITPDIENILNTNYEKILKNIKNSFLYTDNIIDSTFNQLEGLIPADKLNEIKEEVNKKREFIKKVKKEMEEIEDEDNDKDEKKEK